MEDVCNSLGSLGSFRVGLRLWQDGNCNVAAYILVKTSSQAINAPPNASKNMSRSVRSRHGNVLELLDPHVDTLKQLLGKVMEPFQKPQQTCKNNLRAPMHTEQPPKTHS